MRKLIAAGVFSVFFVATGAAIGDIATSPSGQIESIQVTHSKTKRNALGGSVTISIGLSKADGSTPAATTRAVVHLPKGMRLDYLRFPKCDANRLRSRGPSGCPRGSKVGTGSLRAEIKPVGSEIEGEIVAFNGKPLGGQPTYLLYTTPFARPPMVIVGKLGATPEGPILDFDVPLVPTLGGQSSAVLVFFEVRTGAKIRRAPGSKRFFHYLQNPRTCKDPWIWQIDFTYDNGEQLKTFDGVPCRK